MHHSQMIVNIDVEADIIRTRVVGDPVRVFEYQWAETEANAYKAAGYTGTVPVSVSSWATAKGWTPQQACDDILGLPPQCRPKNRPKTPCHVQTPLATLLLC